MQLSLTDLGTSPPPERLPWLDRFERHQYLAFGADVRTWTDEALAARLTALVVPLGATPERERTVIAEGAAIRDELRRRSVLPVVPGGDRGEGEGNDVG